MSERRESPGPIVLLSGGLEDEAALLRDVLSVESMVFWWGPLEGREAARRERLLHDVAETLGVTYSARGALLWLEARNHALGDAQPIARLYEGDVEAVLRAARALGAF